MMIEMRPLSPTRRRAYLFILFVLFCFIVPVALLFAAGWRYKAGIGLVRTGGIFVSVPYSGATISLDGTLVGESGFLNHRLYLSDLAPSAYVVRVEKEGYRTWDKVLVVEPTLVTDAQALLVPQEVSVYKLALASAATNTVQMSAATLASIRTAFDMSFASSTANALVHDGEQVVVERGDVMVSWTKAGEKIPSIFCGRPSFCATSIAVERTKQTALSAAFYGRGVVYTTREGGVFFSEVDVRPSVTPISLYPHAGATFRIVGGQLVIQYKGSYYRLVGF